MGPSIGQPYCQGFSALFLQPLEVLDFGGNDGLLDLHAAATDRRHLGSACQTLSHTLFVHTASWASLLWEFWMPSPLQRSRGEQAEVMFVGVSLP
jgi:hypothetical protein